MVSQPGRLPKWSEITREERFFTCVLFHDLREDPNPVWTTLRNRLGCPTKTVIVDVGFEVCFFRDVAHARRIERHRELEKQTFDLVLTLSDQSLVIIEAKAQQGFTTKQMEMLCQARKKIRDGAIWPGKDVYLAALYSSKYTPRSTTLSHFDGFLLWSEVADAYPPNRAIYLRADKIYRDRSGT
jgi:hypothetical protein